MVGFPGSPLQGISAALEFYRQLTKEIRTDGEERLHTYYADDAVIIENLMTATVTGQFLGIPETAAGQVPYPARLRVPGRPDLPRERWLEALRWPRN